MTTEEEGSWVTMEAGSKGDAAVNQGMQVTSRSWEREGADSPLGLPEGSSPVDALILAQRDRLWTFDLQNCKRISLCYFKA